MYMYNTVFLHFGVWMHCRENETMKAIGEKTSAAFKRTGTVIKDTGTKAGTKISSAAYTLKVRAHVHVCTHAYAHECNKLPIYKVQNPFLLENFPYFFLYLCASFYMYVCKIKSNIHKCLIIFIRISNKFSCKYNVL